ncbi:methionine synthase II (cobalamin-independent)-like protein [Agromyces allii]|uniref:5-methyltetrahydropteroyltriglutamate--homocysteine S-methyltransferase n=1 Tax=Agromyces allii TaxID=393607 RepID=A0ABP5BC58_9MICO|nr:methionine synthase II (cobalamin-independent)-like protein [Agromyces allii]
MADTYIFRIDHHGSLIRPAGLVAARQAHRDGELDAAALREVEDSAITEAVRMQRKLNLTATTDGEFRRDDFRAAVLGAVTGFADEGLDRGGMVDFVSNGPVSRVEGAGGGLVVEDALFAAALSEIPGKASLPSPAFLVARAYRDGVGPYESPEALGEALAAVIRDEVRALIEAGIRYVQIDDPNLSAYYTGRGGDAVLSLEAALALDASVLEGLDRPDDVRVALCPDWGRRGDGPIDEGVFEQIVGSLPYDRYLLPYHEQRHVDEALLRFVPEQVDIALGVVSATAPELEDVDEVMLRLDRAFELKDLDRIALAPHRGFQLSAFETPAMTIEQQRRKLETVETLARMCWGNEL